MNWASCGRPLHPIVVGQDGALTALTRHAAMHTGYLEDDERPSGRVNRVHRRTQAHLALDGRRVEARGALAERVVAVLEALLVVAE
eukprot:scaffold66498_cov77-Phaeocystis_antarctica.AAC.2